MNKFRLYGSQRRGTIHDTANEPGRTELTTPENRNLRSRSVSYFHFQSLTDQRKGGIGVPGTLPTTYTYVQDLHGDS